MGGYGGVGDWASRTPRTTILDLTGAGTRAFYGTGSDKLWLDGLTFQNASHAGDGGAVLKGDSPGNYWQGQVTINDCKFVDNAGGNGGAVYADGRTKCYITNSDFINNSATGSGGALYAIAYNGTRGVVDCNFHTNSATVEGGALFLSAIQAISGIANGLYPVQRTTFLGNSAASGGAASGSSEGAALYECLLAGNSCTVNGAALYADGDFNWGEVQNCLIVENTGGCALYGLVRNGWEIYNLKHCTVADNPGGGIYVTDGNLSWREGQFYVRNCIIADNGDYGINLADLEPTLDIPYAFEYNDVHGHSTANYAGSVSAGGTGSVSVDPKFEDADNDDYRLSETSTILDSGTDLSITVDLLGDTRPDGAGPAMGCYELAVPAAGTLVSIQ
jgi:predicted outer membrane repeat protein